MVMRNPHHFLFICEHEIRPSLPKGYAMQRTSFNQNWFFHLGEIPQRQKFEDQHWRALNLPHDWSIELPRKYYHSSGASGGFFPAGFAWYRKVFDAPAAWKGKKVFIEFEGVYMNAEVWLNGNFLGRHPYGYTSFTYDLTPFLKPGEKNELRVSVDNACQPNSRWYSGSGIYRPVWLWVGAEVHIPLWGMYITTPQVSSAYASVAARVRVKNESQEGQDVTLRSYILAPDEQTLSTSTSTASIEPGSEHEFTQKTHLPAPHLWSTETPALYVARCEVVVNGRVVDETHQPFGIRQVQIDAENGLRLNGKPLKLRGGCVHHDNGVLGALSLPRAEERKVELLKASGFNALRTAHNPPAPAFLDACDRLGLLVVDEAFDCWREGKNLYDYHTVFDDWWQRDVESMLLRDRNHPSVILWSIGNEVGERDGRSNGEQTARRLADFVRSMDPTRPVTAALCRSWDGKDWSTLDAVFSTLDVCGYNYAWKEYAPDHQRHARRVIFGSESFPKEAFENWEAVLENPHVIGDFVWTACDYLGEAGLGRVHDDPQKPFLGVFPWHMANCGDLDLCGFKRPQSYYRDMVWGVGEKLFIAVHSPKPKGREEFITDWGWAEVSANWNWTHHEGEVFDVDVYSTCERVELSLNSRSLGVQPAGKANRFLTAFKVPYEAGELKAVGYSGGQAVEVKVLQTASRSVQIRLTPDRESLKADPFDLCAVTVEVVDREGRLQPQATHIIRFKVHGEGTLLAVGNADPTSTGRYRGDRCKVFHGRCLAVLQSGGKPGEIRLRAEGNSLEASEIAIRVIA